MLKNGRFAPIRVAKVRFFIETAITRLFKKGLNMKKNIIFKFF